MARVTKPLTNTEVDRAKPKEKEFSLVDGQGLFLRVKPTGVKTWIFNYYHPTTKKRTNITIGKYPEISIAQAGRIPRFNCARDSPPNPQRESTARTGTSRSKHLFSGGGKMAG